MFKSAVRAAPKRFVPSQTFASTRRFLSTAPPAQKRRSWKNSAARWMIAGAGVYYYNTSKLFAEEPEASIEHAQESIAEIKEKTIEEITEEKRLRYVQDRQRDQAAKATLSADDSDSAQGEQEGGLEGLEGEAAQQGAFNEETGEINWDCPCLGGMAQGPCGEEFKAAFSCFVYSKEEPKGVECIEKFKGMQDCFRAHPEMYPDEMEDDEDAVEEELLAREAAKDEESAPGEGDAVQKQKQKPAEKSVTKAVEDHRDSVATTSEQAQKLGDEGGELLPKSVHDATR